MVSNPAFTVEFIKSDGQSLVMRLSAVSNDDFEDNNERPNDAEAIGIYFM